MGICQFLVPHEREYWIRPGETLAMMLWLGAAIVAPRWRGAIPAVRSSYGREHGRDNASSI
jgi:hypothetical protein